MAVRIRLKRLGRKNRPFYRVCAMDSRTARDGKVIEELGTYDPLVGDTDARCVLNNERVGYWLSVGALPTEKVSVLIKKYGPGGTHEEVHRTALAKLAEPREVPPAPKPVFVFRGRSAAEAAVAEAPPQAAPEAQEAASPPAEEAAAESSES